MVKNVRVVAGGQALASPSLVLIEVDLVNADGDAERMNITIGKNAEGEDGLEIVYHNEGTDETLKSDLSFEEIAESMAGINATGDVVDAIAPAE